MTKYCSSCGKEIADGTKFCPSCGKISTPEMPSPVQPQATPVQTPENEKKGITDKLRNIGIPGFRSGKPWKMALATFVYFILLLAIISSFSEQPNNRNVYKTTPARPVYQTYNEIIIDKLVTVQAGQYKYQQFSVPSTATISGSFTASGGSGNDIEVYIFSETDYTNWMNNHDASTYYNSKRMTTGKITVEGLPKGNYYLIYSNKFSTVSEKNIMTKVSSSYTKCIQNC